MKHLEVYVEEPSAKEALDRLLPRIIGEPCEIQVHPFRGKQHLLREIPKRLRAYARWAPDDWRVVILVDEDREDCHDLKLQLLESVESAGIADRTVCRIAVEELEAWFFGDVQALRSVYPRIPPTLARRSRYRDPDAITGGTWEALDRVLREAGYPQGLVKTSAAKEIARHMDPQRNTSHSFQVFCEGVRRILDQSR